ncbi:universal stress protein family protein [Saccharopolyspora erythraea NRRL 2338]|uniref:Universal stress protein n=2 Tax=Saccharopolyspora erythraea TaxID=1836 RepID=A4FDQ6_SACEN|nr:universal stress protein [Saccharopolyspora erythraea]EQD82628.1 universal stress protein [Saccharopolyspora erythraea D]PFG95914.1 universal stress protein family protein [Saccharopolyspora erythraea NRRL 2338]QRK92484.1 universal stress protein [Saccharopolyspora erythraea]CAM02181.1 universal stress protein [Saccharopolyspora erythraea NRRL 2338]
MTIMVAVPDSVEGRAALDAAVAEAQRLDTELVVVNLALTDLAAPEFPPGLSVTVLDREGLPDRDPADAVLDEIRTRSVDRLVIGIRRRSPVGKALLGSISQRLLLDSPVPVLAIKPSEAE